MDLRRASLPFLSILLVLVFGAEASAVRPPIRPLDMEHLQRMVDEADVIVVGTISSVTRSKTPHPPRETVVLNAVLKAETILKGNRLLKTITIQESYQQFSSDESHDTNITVSTAGPPPSVGVYHEGERVVMFLISINANGLFRPVGSGDYETYLGMLQISSRGVLSDRYPFDETVSKYARSEESFCSLIESLTNQSSIGK